jgi:predicted P-loop ATPase
VPATPVHSHADLVEWVSNYALAGWHPIELAPSDAPWAKSPGKQPVDKAWENQEKPKDPISYAPTANVGLRMGPQADGSFLVAVDVDGDPADLLRLAPEWPETLVAETRPGRHHLVYTWPEGLALPRNAVRSWAPDGKTSIDIRSTGGQIAVYPSTHPDTGLQYRVSALAILASQNRSGSRKDVARPAVPPLADTMTSQPGSQSSTTDGPILAGEIFPISPGNFVRVCKKLAKRNTPTAGAFENLARGVPFAEPGSRDEMIWRLCCALAREVPLATPESIEAQFQTSLGAMHALSPFKAPSDVAAKFARAVSRLTDDAPEIAFLQTSTGQPVPAAENVFRALRQSQALVGRIGYDMFANRITWTSPAPWDEPNLEYPRQYTDRDSTDLSAYLHATHRLNVKSALALECVVSIAHKNPYHPVRDYLLDVSSQWDGTPRIDTWLTRHIGCEDTEYTRKVSAWWLMQAVARVADPGCQADYTMIFEGTQGRGKTQSLKLLASKAWFLGNLSPIGNKDAMVDLAGKWIVELSELTGLRSEVNMTKSFLSRETDHYRAPYGKISEDYPRQCVFAGSTNEYEYLQDPTGNRRFWPVVVSEQQIDRGAIEAERDQLWAEAAIRLAAGEKPYPQTDADRAMFASEVEKRRLADSWEDKLADWMQTPVGLVKGRPITSAWLLSNVLDQGLGKRQDDTRLNSVLRVLGWTRALGGRGRDWIPPRALEAPKCPVAIVVPIRKVGA